MVERIEERSGTGERTEPALGLERRQRADQFGLVVRVSIGPVGGIDRDALFVLVDESGLGPLQRGVCLDRQGDLGCEHLEQERQLSEVVVDPLPQQGGRARADRVEERLAAIEQAGGLGMCPHPELGFGFTRRGGTDERRDRPGLPPCVMLDLTVQRKHRWSVCTHVAAMTAWTSATRWATAASSAASRLRRNRGSVLDARRLNHHSPRSTVSPSSRSISAPS